MASPPGSGRRSRKELRAELAERDAFDSELRPYLDLAREIHDEVRRVAADPAAAEAALVAAVSRIPDEERDRIGRAVFDALPAEQQWAVLERAYGDEGIRQLLARERAHRIQDLAATTDRRERIRAAQNDHRLDVASLAPGEVLVLGLYLPTDAAAALARGSASDSAARVLTVRREADHPDRDAAGVGWCRVLSDAFNPRGGYFVTADYDRDAWQAEACTCHTRVRLGAIDDDDSFAAALYPGARVDLTSESGDGHRGRLHLGFATIDGEDVFGP